MKLMIYSGFRVELVKMKTLRQWLIAVISTLPFARFILKSLYSLAINRAKSLPAVHPEIVDIYLLSNLSDKNFVYGQSDLNIVLIIEDDAKPKVLLARARKTLRQIWPANVLIDLNKLPVLKESEFKTPLIRSHLITGSSRTVTKWESLVHGKELDFKVLDQGYFAKHYFHILMLEMFLLKEVTPRTYSKHWIRSYGKNVSLALEGLSRDGLINPIKDSKWKRYAAKLFGFSPFARIYFPSHRERTWKILDQDRPLFEDAVDQDTGYPEHLLSFLDELLKNPIVEDALIIPSLLQNTDKIKGKAFIDIILSSNRKDINKKDFRKLQRQVDQFIDQESKVEDAELKFDFNFTTITTLKLRQERALFTYPLEGWYRSQKAYSAKGRQYTFQIKKQCVEQAIIHFLLLQFMRFRTQKLATSLIGSKFMKSLNLMNRYTLILDYLSGKEMEIPEKYSDMMSNITPQLATYRSKDPVQAEDWPLIKSQLVYSLKKIRDELAKKHPTLKNLQF